MGPEASPDQHKIIGKQYTGALHFTVTTSSVEKVKILSLLPVIGHPRDSKRIDMLTEAGFDVEAVAFERDYHKGRLPNCPVEKLGKISHGQYFRRLIKMMAVLPKLRQAIRRNHGVYTSGPDMALIAWISGLGLRRPLFLEIGDIRAIQVAPGLLGGIVRFIDKTVASACSLLVVTSAGFLDHYYRKRLKTVTPAIVIENKIESTTTGQTVLPPKRNPQLSFSDHPLRIGYFGVLRCEWSWLVLEAFAKAWKENVRITVAGHPMCTIDIPERVKDLANVEYLGPFQSPQDLPDLYSAVDLVWACYPGPDSDRPEWWTAQAICRSNRFYESCFFRTPLISLRGSGDAEIVDRYGIGLVLKDQEIPEVVKSLSQLQPQLIAEWQNQLETVPRDIYEYTHEVDDLSKAIKLAVRPS